MEPISMPMDAPHGKDDQTPPRQLFDDDYLLALIGILFALFQLAYAMRVQCTC